MAQFGENILTVNETPSTQDIAAEIVRISPATFRAEVILARSQTRGRGRFDRHWQSSPGSSLTASFVLWEAWNHSEPWLFGMAFAYAAAKAIGAKVWWPNDIVVHGKKVGGIITDLVDSPKHAKIPVVGLGVNLTPDAYDAELLPHATSVLESTNKLVKAEVLLERVLRNYNSIPELNGFESFLPMWSKLDVTAGRSYKKPSGEIGKALGVSNRGELILQVKETIQYVHAAEAWLEQDTIRKEYL